MRSSARHAREASSGPRSIWPTTTGRAGGVVGRPSLNPSGRQLAGDVALQARLDGSSKKASVSYTRHRRRSRSSQTMRLSLSQSVDGRWSRSNSMSNRHDTSKRSSTSLRWSPVILYVTVILHAHKNCMHRRPAHTRLWRVWRHLAIFHSSTVLISFLMKLLSQTLPDYTTFCHAV